MFRCSSLCGSRGCPTKYLIASLNKHVAFTDSLVYISLVTMTCTCLSQVNMRLSKHCTTLNFETERKNLET